MHPHNVEAVRKHAEHHLHDLHREADKARVLRSVRTSYRAKLARFFHALAERLEPNLKPDQRLNV